MQTPGAPQSGTPKAGNVREQPLDQLVDESELFAELLDRSRLKGRCGRCRYQYTCGGCRAMAYYHPGDYLAEDPTCFFDPEESYFRKLWIVTG